jgi:hypothetical protein
MTANVETPPVATDPQSPSARRAMWFGWWFYVTVMFVAPFALLLTAVVAVLLWWKLADLKAAREVKLEVARIQALGEPVTIYDLYAWHRVPEGTNDTTALWLNALSLADSVQIRNTKFVDLPIFATGHRETLAADHPQSTLDLAADFLRVNDEAVQAALAAAREQGNCRLPVAFEAGVAALSSTQRARNVARLMLLRTRVAVERGNAEEAVESTEANLALARAIDHQPTIVDHLLRIAIIGIATSDVEFLLDRSELSEEQLARLQRRLQAVEIRSGFTTSLLGERGIGYHEFHQFPSGTAPRIATAAQPMAGGKLTRPADCRFYLEMLQEYIDASRQPFPKSINASKQIAARVQTVGHSTNPLERMRYVLSMEVVPGTEAAVTASARGQAMRDLTLVAIAARRYQLKHGEFPRDLQALSEFLEIAPIDPYDGQPLRLIRKDGELVLYSVGQDGRDDGGLELEDGNQPDIVVRLK